MKKKLKLIPILWVLLVLASIFYVLSTQHLYEPKKAQSDEFSIELFQISPSGEENSEESEPSEIPGLSVTLVE